MFGVAKFLDINSPINARGCGADNCRVVNIFNFDASATVQAFVRLDTHEVVEVYYQPSVRPSINRRLADRAMEIALNEPLVIEVIGEQRTNSDWAPMDSTLVGSACERGHMCVAPTFDMGDYIFWAIVDLTDDKFLDTFWTATDGSASGAYAYPDAYGNMTPEGCPAPGSVNRNGWQLDYNNTATDSLRISNARYNGTLVITSAKLVEWHADYGSSGYEDATGCGGDGGGFPIYPYGNPQVNDIMDGPNVIGFEVVQDFRMGSWGSGCNYRYEQRFEFYSDGRFRTKQGAFGKGCGTNSLYRGLMRVDLAVGGTEGNDNIATWGSSNWHAVSTESRWCPEGETNAGCTSMVPGLNLEGYRFRIWDSQTDTGYYMEPGRGQFSDLGQGDNEFVYAVVHNASEGDNDLGIIGGCCNNYDHGPEQYVNGGNTTDANLVLWYIPQMLTDAAAPDYYCWTVQGEPNPITYPCWAGPMFHPYSDNQTPVPPTAGFTVPNQPYFATDEAIQFTNTSSPGVPNTITWAWDFEDGGTSTLQNPMHTYNNPGTYNVTLTVDNGVYSDTYSADVRVEADVTNTSIGMPAPGPGGSYYVGDPLQFNGSANEGLTPEALTFDWNFGDDGTSEIQNPIHTYNAAGTYVVSLTAGNGYFTETVTNTIAIVNQPTAVTLGELNATNGNSVVIFGFVAGLALLAGAGVVLRRK